MSTISDSTLDRRPSYSLLEATRVLGYRHPGTVRAKHLAKDHDAAALGKRYYDGKIFLDKVAVDELGARLKIERAQRGEWRSKNLGAYLKRPIANE